MIIETKEDALQLKTKTESLLPFKENRKMYSPFKNLRNT